MKTYQKHAGEFLRDSQQRLRKTLLLVVVLAVSVLPSARGQENRSEAIVYPGESWKRISPAEAGFEPGKWKDYIARVDKEAKGYPAAGQNPQGQYGCVIVRAGYLVAEIGNADLLQNSASVGKAFNKIALQLAIDRGLIGDGDDLIADYWTGRGLFDDPAKEMDRGHHASITWKQLAGMRGGFPISNGFDWASKNRIPDWAQWTGDATKDNRAHRPPGKGHYSSGGQWRLNQALTAVTGKELKTFLDEELFSKIGIEPDAWRWETGQVLHDKADWYPAWPAYGAFCDPPYSIGGNRVHGGGGWVFMTPKDLARIGLLVASRGIWNGERLISDTSLLAGHAGFSHSVSLMDGDKNSLIVIGKVNWGAKVPKLTLDELTDLLNQRR